LDAIFNTLPGTVTVVSGAGSRPLNTRIFKSAMTVFRLSGHTERLKREPAAGAGPTADPLPQTE